MTCPSLSAQAGEGRHSEAAAASENSALVRDVSGPGNACNQAADSLSLCSQDQTGRLVRSCFGCILPHQFCPSDVTLLCYSPSSTTISRITSDFTNSLPEVLLHLNFQPGGSLTFFFLQVSPKLSQLFAFTAVRLKQLHGSGVFCTALLQHPAVTRVQVSPLTDTGVPHGSRRR